MNYKKFSVFLLLVSFFTLGTSFASYVYFDLVWAGIFYFFTVNLMIISVVFLNCGKINELEEKLGGKK